MQRPPHVTVATVVERNEQFLMVEELSDNKRVINQPAGHLEPDEDLISAAVRETSEETGWLVEPVAFLGLRQYLAPNNITYIRATFVAKALREIPNATLDKEIIRVHWLSYSEIKARSAEFRSPMVIADIEQYRNGIRYPLELYVNHG